MPQRRQWGPRAKAEEAPPWLASGRKSRRAVALGFLEITERGRAGNAEYRMPNLFRLTYVFTPRCNPTNEWQQVVDPEAHRRQRPLDAPVRAGNPLRINLLAGRIKRPANGFESSRRDHFVHIHTGSRSADFATLGPGQAASLIHLKPLAE